MIFDKPIDNGVAPTNTACASFKKRVEGTADMNTRWYPGMPSIVAPRRR